MGGGTLSRFSILGGRNVPMAAAAPTKPEGTVVAVAGEIGDSRGERAPSLVPLLVTVRSVRRRFRRGALSSAPLSAFCGVEPDAVPSAAVSADGLPGLGRATRLRMPGTLSGPRRLGTASYSHGLFRLMQLWHVGRVLSHRIFRCRLWWWSFVVAWAY
jgi:hypothetical protein